MLQIVNFFPTFVSDESQKWGDIVTLLLMKTAKFSKDEAKMQEQPSGCFAAHGREWKVCSLRTKIKYRTSRTWVSCICISSWVLADLHLSIGIENPRFSFARSHNKNLFFEFPFCAGTRKAGCSLRTVRCTAGLRGARLRPARFHRTVKKYRQLSLLKRHAGCEWYADKLAFATQSCFRAIQQNRKSCTRYCIVFRAGRKQFFFKKLCGPQPPAAEAR